MSFHRTMRSVVRLLRWLFSADRFEALVAPHEGLSISSEPVCPGCAYSLHMLPETGRCPECGKPYDQITRFTRVRRPILGVGVVLLPTLIAVIATILSWVAMQFRPTGEIVPLLGLVTALGMIFVGNGAAAGLCLRWLVVRRRVRRMLDGETAVPVKRGARAVLLGVVLATIAYFIVLGLSIALIVGIVSKLFLPVA